MRQQKRAFRNLAPFFFVLENIENFVFSTRQIAGTFVQMPTAFFLCFLGTMIFIISPLSLSLSLLISHLHFLSLSLLLLSHLSLLLALSVLCCGRFFLCFVLLPLVAALLLVLLVRGASRVCELVITMTMMMFFFIPSCSDGVNDKRHRVQR